MRRPTTYYSTERLYEVGDGHATSEDVKAVLAAYDAARARRRKTVDCYAAAVKAWRRRHPDHNTHYAGTAAVELVLRHRVPAICKYVS